MAAHSMSKPWESAAPAKMDLLGLAFFVLGAPHLYGALKQRQRRQSKSSTPKYLSLILLAMAIAGLLEFGLL
jgi:hypothetical protein